MRSVEGVALSLLAIIVFAASAVCQDLDNVSFSGRITDSAAMAIPGASVTVIHVDTGTETKATTNADGRYRLIELRPGVYRLRVESTGFGTQERTGIETVAGLSVQLDVTLSPAAINAEQTISISDEDAAMIDTTRTVVGGTITGAELEELPNFDRDPLNLVLTLGGTAEEALSTRDLAEDRESNPRSTPTEQGNFSLSGGVSYSNNITIDGLDNNDDLTAGTRFQPPLEAIEEVQVISSQFSAEYGRASGGRINLRTRGGTNRYRGRAFLFFRDDQLNANTWYNNSRGYERLEMTQYTPGVTFGGPLSIPGIYSGRDRTFFFAAYELDRFNDTTFIDTYIPVVGNPRFELPAPNGNGQFCDAPSNDACTAGTAGYIAGYTQLVPTPNQSHTLTARIDHRLFKNNDLTFSFQFGRKKNRRSRFATTTRVEDALQAVNRDTDAFNISDTQVFGRNVVNQLRFQWSKYEPSYVTDDPTTPVIIVGFRNPVTNSTQSLVAGNSTASGNGSWSDTRIEKRFQIQDSLTWMIGSHTFKAGFDVQHVNSFARSLEDTTGTYNFSNAKNFSDNVVTRYRHTFGTAVDVKNTYSAFFLNDEFRLFRGMNVSLGLRYERESVLDDNNNFAPRFGLAWDPFGDGKTVIRGGAGVFYNRTLLRTVGDYILNTSGALFQFDTNNIGTSAADTRRAAILGRISQQFPQPFASADEIKRLLGELGLDQNLGFVPPEVFRTTDPNLRIPESYNFNIGFERQIAKGLVFEANFTSNKTAHLWREYNPNVPVLPTGYRDWTEYLLANPFIFTNTNGSTRTYNFYLGATNDSSGVRGNAPTNPTATSCSIFSGGTCWINLNSFNTSTTFPQSAVTGTNGNATGTPLGLALAAIARFRPNPELEEMERVASLGNARYNGLILSLRSRSRQIGAFRTTMRVAYTFSKMMDDGLNNTSNAEINTDFAREWARSLQDRRHRLTISGTVATPSWLGKLRFSPVFRFGSSAPFNLGYGSDRNLNDQSTDRLIYSGDLNDLKWIKPGNTASDAFYSLFSLQPIGAASGNMPRNAGIGPRLYIFDLGITREWRFKERFRIRPNVEIGNVFNLAVFSFGSEYIDYFGVAAAPTQTQLNNRRNFLVPTRAYRPRDVKFGLRVDF